VRRSLRERLFSTGLGSSRFRGPFCVKLRVADFRSENGGGLGGSNRSAKPGMIGALSNKTPSLSVIAMTRKPRSLGGSRNWFESRNWVREDR